MVKTTYKRFVKKERNKVKLKGKKLLPKGLNVTDTTFKVKKIVIKEQLKQHGSSEILSKKKLNIKELESRLKHYNVGMRQEALIGLKQLVELYPGEFCKQHLSEFLKAAATLAIDVQKVVRADALKLLSAVMSQVSDDDITPLFPILSSYLACAMTHIDQEIRNDSLKFLDTLLQTTPHLVASQAGVLLPRFLDLISNKSGQSRILSLHLEGKVTAEKWRAQVLYRLRKLLEAINNYNSKQGFGKISELSEQVEAKTLNWERNVDLSVPIYTDIYFQPVTLSLGKCDGKNIKQIDDSKLKIQEYAELLIPLLLATFVEVLPNKNKNNNDTQKQHQISFEAAILLQCIVDIILLLLKLMQQSGDNDTMLRWFRQKYWQPIFLRLIDQRFPYTTSQLHEKIANKKWKKEVSALLSAVENSQVLDGQCLMQNLGLSHIVLLLTNPQNQTRLNVIKFLTSCLRNCGSLNNEQCCLLKNCWEAVFTTSKEVNSQAMLQSVTRLWNHYKQLDRPFSIMLFEFLSGIALNHKLKHLHSEPIFQEWLGTLPELLTFKSITFSAITRISKISTHNIPAFSDSLDGWIEAILDNVPSIKVEGCAEEDVDKSKKEIISLLYWVKDWDENMLLNLQKAISVTYFGPELTPYLIDILRLRVQNDEGLLASMIGNEDWLQP